MQGNPNPSPSTRFQPGCRGNPGGRPSFRWLRDEFVKVRDGATDWERTYQHLMEVATLWEVRVVGKDSDGELLKVASARESVEAIKLLWAYGLGGAPKCADPVALAEHLRQVEKDRVSLALDVLGQRKHSMGIDELQKFFLACAANPARFMEIAQQMLGEESPALAEAVPPQAPEPAQLEQPSPAPESSPPVSPDDGEEPGPCS